MPSTLSELRARAPANVSIFLIALFSDSRILREHLIHALEGVARGLGPVLTGVGRREQHRRRAVFRRRERRRRCAATERDGGATGQPLRLDGDCGVIANRRVVHDGDGGHHVLRPVGAERDLRHVADAEAVEQHRGTDFQAGHRALESHLIDVLLAEAAFVLEPIDEGEAREDHGEHEKSDQGVAGACFHGSGSLRRDAHAPVDQELAALALEICPHPGMGGFEHGGNWALGDHLAVGEGGNAVADRVAGCRDRA